MNIGKVARLLLLPAALAGVLTVSALATGTEADPLVLEWTNPENSTVKSASKTVDDENGGTTTVNYHTLSVSFEIPQTAADTLGTYSKAAIFWGTPFTAGDEDAQSDFSFDATSGVFFKVAMNGTDTGLFKDASTLAADSDAQTGIAFWQDKDGKLSYGKTVTLTLTLNGMPEEASMTPFYIRGAVLGTKTDDDSTTTTTYAYTPLLKIAYQAVGTDTTAGYTVTSIHPPAASTEPQP